MAIILKSLLVLIVVLVLVFIGMMVKLASDSRSMTVNLGVQNGQLSPCPESPNCVSSDALVNDLHYIASITHADEQLWSRLVDSVSAMAGVDVVSRDGAYARFTFKTPVFGFVDDVEFLYQPTVREIAMRSASRVGYGDMNTNRKRLEAIRTALE